MNASLLNRCSGVATRLALFAVLLLSSIGGWAQINISVGNTITQDFNSLGAAANAALPTNWRVAKSATQQTVPSFASAGGSVEFAAGNNMSPTAGNGIYRFNANAATNESS
ncbi:MAG: hypothetical protein WAU70_10155, partial [Flavobacteriales bacterium]